MHAPEPSGQQRMSFPLTGLKVVDFSQGGAGPYCTQLLGDQGADVVKIEPPRGDWAREMGAFNADIGMTATFASMNRNKRGICLDLRQPQARDVALSLCRTADVVVEAFRPGVMDRMGMGYEALARANPGLVYCSVNGFGLTGPNKDLPASDSVLQPYGGLMSIVGEDGGDPLRVANIVSDMLAATNAFGSVMLGLYRRATTGEGGHVSTNLLDSIVAFQATNVSEYLLTGVTPRRMGNRHPLIASSGVYKAADGHIAMAVLDHYWAGFCEAMEVRALSEDPRFATPESRQEHRRALWALLQETVAARPVAHWLQRLRERDILCAPVQDYPALVRDPQVLHNGIVGEVRDRKGARIPMVKNPMTLEGRPVRYTPPPSLGQHTLQVLQEDLGLPPDAVEQLLRSKAAVAGTP